MGLAPHSTRVVGRYALYGAIAAGGMATVHLGRLMGPVGFSRTVAIKRLHAQFASDPEFVTMFLDEARVAARIRHPNVVQTLDVVSTDGELFLVMDYVAGESLARLSRVLRDREETIPIRILSAIMAGVLHGLHSAHEAKDERGEALGIVHRDVSPQNVIVGTDGIAKILDFGVAKATGRMQTTREGQIKGKLSYMPPEQLRGAVVTRQSDIYAAGVMLWELVTGQRLFVGDNEGVVVTRVLEGKVDPPSKVLKEARGNGPPPVPKPGVPSIEALDATILRALHMRPEARFQTARDMAVEIERRCPPATASEVADWVEAVAKDVLHSRAALIAEIESSASHAAVETQENHVRSVLQQKEGRPADDMMGLPMIGGLPTIGGDVPSMSTRVATPQAIGSSPNLSAPNFNAPNFNAPNFNAHSSTYSAVSASSAPHIFDGAPVTQPSSISVSTGTHGRYVADGGNKRRTALVVAIGLLFTLSALAGVLVYRQQDKDGGIRGGAAATPLPDGKGATADGTADRAGSATTTGNPGAGTVAATPTNDSADAGSAGSAGANAAASGQGNGATSAAATNASAKTTKRPGGAGGAAVKPSVTGGAGGATGGGATAPVTPPPQTAPASDTDDCSTPVWYDAQGVKHYKPQCLVK